MILLSLLPSSVKYYILLTKNVLEGRQLHLLCGLLLMYILYLNP